MPHPTGLTDNELIKMMMDALVVLSQNILNDLDDPYIAAVLRTRKQDYTDPDSPTEYDARQCALREDAVTWLFSFNQTGQHHPELIKAWESEYADQTRRPEWLPK